MKRTVGVIILLFLSFFFIGCGRDDSHISNDIFALYEKELEDNGYTVNKLADATTNITGWFEITDEDVVSIHRVIGERGVLYLFLFPTKKSANKWYDKITAHTEDTDYSVYLDGHYVLTTNDEELNDLIFSINN
ncbi:MAG: hypothetical protein WC006_02000 [Bacilli bacterium]|nr:hypothetical protein [Bacilli bacterium]